LTRLFWADMPAALLEWIQDRAPKVVASSGPEALRILWKSDVPAIRGHDDFTTATIHSTLDRMTIAWSSEEELPPPQRQPSLSPSPSSRKQALSTKSEIPIAERFRLSYVLRSERLHRKHKKEQKRLQRKEIKKSGAKGSIEKWLDE